MLERTGLIASAAAAATSDVERIRNHLRKVLREVERKQTASVETGKGLSKRQGEDSPPRFVDHLKNVLIH